MSQSADGCASMSDRAANLLLLVRLDKISFCLWAKEARNLLIKLLLDGCSIHKLQASLDLWEQRVGIVVVPARADSSRAQLLADLMA